MRIYEKRMDTPSVDINTIPEDADNRIQRKTRREKKRRKNVTFRGPLDFSTSL